MEIKLVKQYLESITTFLNPLLPLANCHMVDFFTKSTYHNYIPENIRIEIEKHGLENTINNIFENNYTNLRTLGDYVETTKRFTLKNSDICASASKFNELLKSWGCANVDSLKLNRFMTSKKSHEVEVLSPVAAAVNHVGDVSHLIDIGDGKGYLSSMLAFHHNVKVLGVDAMQTNTHGAIKRAARLSKAWRGVVGISEAEFISKSDRSAKLDLYKQVTQFVDQNIDFIQLVENVFLEKPSNLGIIGLHTCGNLGPTSVKIFNKCAQMKTICNVSCCYHLLTEKYEEPDEAEAVLEYGFPLSEFLHQKRYAIGRRARMVGAQSVDRIIDKKELPNIHILYRAILQQILQDYCTQLPTKRVGKIKKCEDFLDYTRKALNILETDISLSDVEVLQYFDRFKDKITELYAFYLIRSMISPVVESVILLDRLLFLLESGYSNAFLVQLFDPVTSPRCYGLICIKKHL